MSVRILLCLLAAATLPLRGAPPAIFAGFAGDYTQRGTTKITNGCKPLSGTAAIHFTVSPSGKSARLQISGKIALAKEDERRFSVSLRLKRSRRILITNLAPGFDDQRSARGICVISKRRIAADVPFVFGTTTGKIRLRATLRGDRFTVVQTLETSTLTAPITWTFDARSLD